jgi:glycosyltransferase involved in cell wall biosynthesis
MNSQNIISIVIPTHNRKISLRRTLNALCVQTYPLKHIEVVVVADGCTDQTLGMLQTFRAPFAFNVLDQPCQGPAGARNHGAANAKGNLILFLDDDVEPSPMLVESHASAHLKRPGCVVIGPYPLVFQNNSFIHLEHQNWWGDFFLDLGNPGHRYRYSDLLSGNLSLETELFFSMGGFDSTFQCHEDYEFGIRLIKAGVQFVFAAEAVGKHYGPTDLSNTLLRKYQEGQADVLMLRRYPEIFSTLPLYSFEPAGSFLSRILKSFAFNWPKFGDRFNDCFRHVLKLLEWTRMRTAWRRIFRTLLHYRYWRGVADRAGSRQALADLFRISAEFSSRDEYEIDIDLREGMEAAEQKLNDQRPAAVHLRYGQHHVGNIPPKPGAEPLRGAHLRPFLASVLALPLLEAMGLERVVPTFSEVDGHLFSESIRSLSFWYGPMDPEKMWWEQYNQWSRLL